MNTNFNVVDPIGYKEWNRLLIACENYAFFHTSNWAEVLQETYAFKNLYFSMIDTQGMMALLPIMEVNSLFTGKRGVSLPFTDYCEPILSNANGSHFQEMLDQVKSYGYKHGWRHFELRGGEEYLQEESPSASFYGHTLDLTEGPESLYHRFRESTQRNIRKAEREGVELSICSNLDSMRQFYRLNTFTRKYHGLPPQPFKFFVAFHDHILAQGLGFVILAFFQNHCIAGAVFLHIGDKAIFKYGASDRNYQHLRANNLIMWQAIKWYSENGFKTFCFGRTDCENTGLRQFKKGWGASERIIKYFKYDLHKGIFVSGQPTSNPVYAKILAKMPPSLLNRIGAVVYRHFG